MDPNPAFGKSNLNDYLSGFGGVKATIAAAVQMIPKVPVSRGFLVVGRLIFDISSVAGACGLNLDLPSVTAAQPPGAGASYSIFPNRFCDGAQSLYQLDSIPLPLVAAQNVAAQNPGSEPRPKEAVATSNAQLP